MVKLKEITNYIEKLFPPEYAEDFDNIGLLVGRCDKEISKAVICLDCSKDIVYEAVKDLKTVGILNHDKERKVIDIVAVPQTVLGIQAYAVLHKPT